MKLTENQRKWFIERYCTWVDKQDYDLTKDEIRVIADPFFDDFSIENEALVDGILAVDHRQVALSLLAYLYVFTHDEMMHVNPMAQDYLAERESITGFMNSVSDYPNLIENSRNALEDMADKMVLILMEVRNHERIGAELGLKGKELGIYDALRGYFSAAYSYNVLLATRELNRWLFDDKQIHTREELAERIKHLFGKYSIVANERLANEYIAGEIMQWKDEPAKEGQA